MRELPPPDQLLKPHDHDTIIVLPPEGWHCVYCVPRAGDYIGTVEWIPGPNGEEFGRCRECGQHYTLLEE